MEHKSAPLLYRHPPENYQFATATERLAASVAASDLYKTALQLDDHSIWRAIAVGTGAGSWESAKAVPFSHSHVIGDVTGLQAALDSKPTMVGGLIQAGNLPSYVDDVLEFANYAALPVTGETGKLYVTLDTNFSYRWSGSAYIQIVSSPGSTTNVPEGTNLYFTAVRAIGALLTGLSTASAADLVATDSIVTAFGKLQAKWNALAATVRGVVLTGFVTTDRTPVAATDTLGAAVGKLAAAVRTGVAIPVSSATTLSYATHNAQTLVATGNPALTFATGLGDGMGFQVEGAFTYVPGGCTFSDRRITGATDIVATFSQIGTDSYVIRGGKA